MMFPTPRLLPRKHTRLQAAVVEQFAPRYAPDASVVYKRRAADEAVLANGDRLASLGIHATEYGELPEVVLYDPEMNRLFLVDIAGPKPAPIFLDTDLR